jgi:hypothetical protein
VGSLISLVLIFAFLPIFRTFREHPLRFYGVLGTFLVLTVAYVIYLEVYPFGTAVDAANLESAYSNAYKLLGSLVGLCVMYALDAHVFHYETKAPILAQILKLILGAAVVIVIKSALKSPLLALTGGHACAGAIRYFLMFAVGGLCPAAFPYLSRFANLIAAKCKKADKEQTKE